jgi:NAD(P)-dependent dehydrogenase (short-subunit alcohol dehydrogenase family)
LSHNAWDPGSRRCRRAERREICPREKGEYHQSMTPRILITGASRGIGLELTKQYLAAGARVLAAARKPGQGELSTLAAQHPQALSLVTLDVTREEHLPQAVAAVRSQVDGLDLLINNAGMNLRGQSLGSYTREVMLETLHTNAVAPILVGQAFLGLLRRGNQPKLVHISSQVGSFTWNAHGRSPLYAASKAALNMYTRCIALESPDITTVVVHPGWVQTDMGGPSAPLHVTDAVGQIRTLISRLEPSQNGHFLNYDGRPHPW